MSDLRHDLDAWVTLSVELADPAVDRAAVLRSHGLDEDAWEAIDDAWQTRLSEAEGAAEREEGDAVDPRGGVPPLVAAHAEAFARAQAARAGAPLLDLPAFAELTRALQRRPDVAAVLRRFDLSLAALLHNQAHWTKRLLEDPELARQFDEAVRGGR